MNILTFDIEEWFHLFLENHSKDFNKEYRKWNYYEVRIHENIERILNLLEKYNQRATFFCLGWIAEKYPEVIKKISDKGFEIGSHTQTHRLLFTHTPESLRKELDYSIKLLEDISGQNVKYFRAPGFSLKEENKWAFEIIHEMGIEVDFSIFPAPRSYGGFIGYDFPGPSIVNYKGFKVKELPINYINIFGKPVIFSGGGYFRLFPYYLIRNWTKKSDYVMSYLHPRDFDYEQPVLKELPKYRRFKSYVGLKSSLKKLEKWLADFKFIDGSEAISLIDWNDVPVINV